MKTKLSSINAARRVVFLSTILFFIVGTANAQYVEGWKKLCTGISENLYGVCCIDANTVVACGENGKILKSTDNGTTWNTTFEKEGYDLIHIDFADENVGYAWGDSSIYNGNHKGIIVKTTDGGISWQELENTAFATLCNEELLQYSKMVVSSPTSFSIFDGDQHIWSSCDGGLTFNTFELNLSTLYSQHPVCYSEMHFEDETGYLILGTDWYSIRVFKTPNYGGSWATFNSVTSHGSFGVEPIITHFYSKNHAGVYNYYEFNYQWGSEYYDMFYIDGGLEQHNYFPLPCFPINWFQFNKAKFTSNTYGCILGGKKMSDGTTKWAPFIAKNDFQSKFIYVPYGIPTCDENNNNCTELYDLDGIDTTFFIASSNGIVFKSAMVPMNGGEEWYYEILNDDGSITYQHLEYAADTTIGTERPKIIVRSNTIYDRDAITTEVTHEYVFERDGKVYWWNKDLEEFTTLYDLTAETGDEWEIKVGTESLTMHVNSVDSIVYEGRTFHRLHVSDPDDLFSGDIVCDIGHLTSFFPERLMNRGKGYRVEGLRCYWIGDELVYHDGDEDCDAIYAELHNGIDEDGPSTPSTGSGTAGTFAVYPNPTDGILFVQTLRATSLPNQTYRITNLMGQTILQGNISAENQQIDIANLPEGMYFISVDAQTVKFVVK